MVVGNLDKKFFQFFRITRLILMTIPSLLLIPCALLLICAPIYFCRFIVSQLKKIFRRDLAKMVVTRSSIMAVDDWNGLGGDQPKCNLVLTMCFEGQLNFDLLLAIVDEKLIQMKKESGESAYPECRQYYEKWLGFMFWKWEEGFNLRRHIRYYDEENPDRPITSKDLIRIEADLTGRPFTPGHSPWEVLVFPNYHSDYTKGPGQKSALIYRLHHGIADGYSLLNLLLREICELYEHQYALPSQAEQPSLCQRVVENLVFAVRAPYESIKQQVECRDYNEWRFPEAKMSRVWFHSQTNPIPLDYIKEIKRIHKVSFTAVLVAALSGGIRNYLLKRGRPVSPQHSLAPFPLPNRVHTKKLRNFYTFAFLKFPVHIADPKLRMAAIQKNLEHLRTSTTPLTNFWQIPIFGGLFAGMIKSCVNNYLSTSIMSNFPGPNEMCQFLGNPVIEMGHIGGVVHGNAGLGFAMLSYFGNLTIRARGCKSLFPTEAHLDDLLSEVCLELEVLKKLDEV